MIPSRRRGGPRTTTECLEELVSSDGFLGGSYVCIGHQYAVSCSVQGGLTSSPRSLVRRPVVAAEEAA